MIGIHQKNIQDIFNVGGEKEQKVQTQVNQSSEELKTL